MKKKIKKERKKYCPFHGLYPMKLDECPECVKVMIERENDLKEEGEKEWKEMWKDT